MTYLPLTNPPHTIAYNFTWAPGDIIPNLSITPEETRRHNPQVTITTGRGLMFFFLYLYRLSH